MKILIVTFSSEINGGANRSLLSVIKGLKEKNHDIKVIVPRKTGKFNDELTKENIPWSYCKYYRMGARPFKGIGKIISKLIVYAKFVQQLFASKKLLRIIKKERYDVIYTNTILPYLGLFAAKKKNIPSVMHDREQLDGTTVHQIKNYEKFLYNHNNKIIVISSDLKRQWERRGFNEKISLVLNGIPIEKVKKSKQLIKDNFNLLLTARITSGKHQIDALKALKILKDKGIENIKLFFAGTELENRDFEYKKLLENFIKNNSLEKNVEFLGEIDDISKFREKMNVELMCNPTEPFGRVTVEGMRSGLIVIGVNAGGTQDIIINDVNGLLYEKNNILDLAEKIEKVYLDNEYRLRLADKAYKYSQNHFTVEENVNNIEKVLLDVIN